MAHSAHVGKFVVIVVVVYLLVRYWKNIKGMIPLTLSPVVSQSVPSTSPSVVSNGPTTPSNANDSFGGGNFTAGPPAAPSRFGIPTLFSVPPGGNVGFGQTDESASGSPFVYINTSKFFRSGCSTHLWDGKPLCE